MSGPLTAQQIRVLVELGDSGPRGARSQPEVLELFELRAMGLVAVDKPSLAWTLTPAGCRAAVLAQSDELIR